MKFRKMWHCTGCFFSSPIVAQTYCNENRQFAQGRPPQVLQSPLQKKAMPSAIPIEGPVLALRGAPPGAPLAPPPPN